MRSKIIEAARALLADPRAVSSASTAVADAPKSRAMTIYYQFESKAKFTGGRCRDIAARSDMRRMRRGISKNLIFSDR